MQYDVNILNEYVAKGLLEVQSHPTLPLKIYNYSRECAWEKKWDEITTAARGLILNEDGYVIAKGFSKFLNYEEYTYDQIPWGDKKVLIQDKADGSLGIIFWFAGEWHIATRGSFTSDQAVKAMKILKKNHPTYNDDLHTECTYLVEIIYPENRIVLDYFGAEKLILLGMNAYCDEEVEWEKVVELNDGFFELVPTIVMNSNIQEDMVKHIKARNLANREGYVLRFSPSNFRMKIKFEEYVRLHSLMTQFSNVDIWRCLSTNTPIDLENVPDEFDAWVKSTIKKLKDTFDETELYASVAFADIYIGNNQEFLPKKEFALLIQKEYPKWMHSILFKMLDGKDYSPIIWKIIRPKYSKPFWQKEVEI